MDSIKCDICGDQEYETIWLYDNYKKILERNELDQTLEKKLKDFVDKQKSEIRVCHGCVVKILGKNKIK